jgi:hypothetical protein
MRAYFAEAAGATAKFVTGDDGPRAGVARGISAQATTKISRRAFHGSFFCCSRVSNDLSKETSYG